MCGTGIGIETLGGKNKKTLQPRPNQELAVNHQSHPGLPKTGLGLGWILGN